MNKWHDIVTRLPEYRALASKDVGMLEGLPKEALLATIKDLAESLVTLITTPRHEVIDRALSPHIYGDRYPLEGDSSK